MADYNEEVEVVRAALAGEDGDAIVDQADFVINEGRDAEIEAEIDRNLRRAEPALDLAEAVAEVMHKKKDIFQFVQFKAGYKFGYNEGYRAGFRAGYRDLIDFKATQGNRSEADEAQNCDEEACADDAEEDACADDAEEDACADEAEEDACADGAEEDACADNGDADGCAEQADEECTEDAQNKDTEQNANNDETIGTIMETVRLEQSVMLRGRLSAEQAHSAVLSWLTSKDSAHNSFNVAAMKGLVRLQGAASQGASEQNPMVLKHFITTSAVLAVNRVNELRERHPHCRGEPLTQSYRLCLLAAALASTLTEVEENHGFTEELQGTLQKNILAFCPSQLPAEDFLRFGLAVCRFRTIPGLISLPLQSVARWYQKGEQYPYDDADAAAIEPMYAHFIQLLDPCSQYIGWAAALADTGAVYAVALFDHIGASDPSTTCCIQPPINGDEASSSGQLSPQLRVEVPEKTVQKFDYNAPPPASIDLILTSLTGVFRMFKDSSLEDAPEEQQEAAALSICNLVVQKAHERVVQFRRKHRRIEPLILSQSLCNLAAIAANGMARKEDETGSANEPMGNSIVFPDIGERMGVVACRLDEFHDVATESVDYWCRGSKSFPFGKPHEAVKEAEFRQFAQLMDVGSQYMGWGAALTESRVAYAVALFNNVGSTERKNLASLKPPIIGVCVMFQ